MAEIEDQLRRMSTAELLEAIDLELARVGRIDYVRVEYLHEMRERLWRLADLET